MATRRKGGDEGKTADGEVNIGVEGVGELTKRVVRPGAPGTQPPPTGVEATVHYTGRLADGTVFDSSRKRKQEFKFNLGEGRVILGWDRGVATMNKGEVAIIKCSPEYAYGDAGVRGAIPPKATLWFEVELIDYGPPSSGGNGLLLTMVMALLAIVLFYFAYRDGGASGAPTGQ